MATCNIIKSETGGSNIIYDKANVYNTDEEYNKSVNAEVFNKYFLTIAESISCKITGNNKKSSIVLNTHCLIYHRYLIFHLAILFFIIHLQEKLKKIIHSFPWKNSCGYDEISVKVLKISAPFISSPLCRIINLSLNSGVFTTRLKYSIITPLHKKGYKNNVTDYRPISLLTSFSKCFERIIYNRLITHFISNNIFTNSQFGFRKKSSTDKAAYTLINDILTALNNKRIVGGIFFDLEKAFDCKP
jgi:hypothetical protein